MDRISQQFLEVDYNRDAEPSVQIGAADFLHDDLLPVQRPLAGGTDRNGSR